MNKKIYIIAQPPNEHTYVLKQAYDSLLEAFYALEEIAKELIAIGTILYFYKGSDNDLNKTRKFEAILEMGKEKEYRELNRTHKTLQELIHELEIKEFAED